MQWIYVIKQVLTHFNIFYVNFCAENHKSHWSLHYAQQEVKYSYKDLCTHHSYQLLESLNTVLTMNRNSCLTHLKNTVSVCEHCEKISDSY